jgi:glutamine synthetase
MQQGASALAAITNPTVNSYKRINAPRTMSGATWAPNTVTWCRVPLNCEMRNPTKSPALLYP